VRGAAVDRSQDSSLIKSLHSAGEYVLVLARSVRPFVSHGGTQLLIATMRRLAHVIVEDHSICSQLRLPANT
jgi:hypothetical protein